MNEFRNDGSERVTRWYRVAVVGLLAVIAAALLDGRPSLLPAASAQIPDTGLQRQQIVDELRVTNQLLDRIARHLETRTVKVRVASPDELDTDGDARTKGGTTVSPFSGKRSP